MAKEAEKPTSSDKGKAIATGQPNGIHDNNDNKKKKDSSAQDGSKPDLPEGMAVSALRRGPR